MTGRDVGSYVEDLKKAVADKVQLPAGYTLVWSGQYEFMQRVKERWLKLVVPLTLVIIFVTFLLFIRVGGQDLHGDGGGAALISRGRLVPVDSRIQHEHCRVGRPDHGRGQREQRRDVGVFDEACAAARRRVAHDAVHLIDTVQLGAVERIRPMAMIGFVDAIGLIPVMWATGTGADVMKRIAAPQVGGVFSAMILTLFGDSAHLCRWRWWE
ncbi:MAG: efflux RND transporter permease subunit [Nitrospiraceae bacterium]